MFNNINACNTYTALLYYSTYHNIVNLSVWSIIINIKYCFILSCDDNAVNMWLMFYRIGIILLYAFAGDIILLIVICSG